MGLGNDDWMSEWTEVNVLPAGALDPERLLTGVAEPLVRSLSADWDRWHYFWEPELRLRFRWRDTADVSACHARVTAHLDEAREHGALTSWTEADYDGEAEGYGPDLWEAVLADWMSGSELALAVIRAGRDKPEPRSWYWARREHLFANELPRPGGLPSAAGGRRAPGHVGNYPGGTRAARRRHSRGTRRVSR